MNDEISFTVNRDSDDSEVSVVVCFVACFEHHPYDIGEQTVWRKTVDVTILHESFSVDLKTYIPTTKEYKKWHSIILDKAAEKFSEREAA
jgi:hypothetical protein